MISLPLVYTILALIAYTTSFWYLFMHLMSKHNPNSWLIGSVVSLGLALHAAVLYNSMLTPPESITTYLTLFHLLQVSCYS